MLEFFVSLLFVMFDIRFGRHLFDTARAVILTLQIISSLTFSFMANEDAIYKMEEIAATHLS